jgi:hypothetical protein
MVENGRKERLSSRVIYVGNRLEFLPATTTTTDTPGGEDWAQKMSPRKKKTVDKIFITTTKTARVKEEEET